MKSRYLISLVGLALLLSETQVSLSCLGKQTPPMLGQNGTDLSREMQLPGILLPKLLSYWQKQITFFFSKMIGVYHPIFPLLGLKDTNKTKHNFFFFKFPGFWKLAPNLRLDQVRGERVWSPYTRQLSFCCALCCDCWPYLWRPEYSLVTGIPSTRHSVWHMAQQMSIEINWHLHVSCS